MVVSHGRSFAIRPAQIFAAAAASSSGPATSRSCMPSPLEPSLITTIGRNVVKAAFALDFRSPRHSARKPLSEFALPTSTPNSVRCTATFAGAASDASDPASSAGGDAATSGRGAFSTPFMGFSGSISFEAAASGGAMIDFDATSGVAGVAAGGFGAVCCPTEAAAAGPGWVAVVSVPGFSAGAVAVVATGDTAGAGEGAAGEGAGGVF